VRYSFPILRAFYGLALHIRHWLYDDRLLPSQSHKIATICVGNLAVGGTGKTPHVEYLVQTLSQAHHIALLLRGYGRKTRGFLLADADSTANTIGDEAMQLHRKFPNIPVAVCENRNKGVKQLQRMYPDLQAVILDDAMQHRAIRCGLTVLLTAQDNLYIDDHLLPYGRLRDLKHRSLSAQAVIVTKCPDTFRPIDKRVVDNRLRLPAFQQLYFSKMVYPELPKGFKKPLVLAGIADPKPFFEHIRAEYPQAQLLAFRDHHRFTKRDIRRLTDMLPNYDVVFTTEKDYERILLTPLPEMLGDKLVTVPIQVELDQPELLSRQIGIYLNETLRKK